VRRLESIYTAGLEGHPDGLGALRGLAYLASFHPHFVSASRFLPLALSLSFGVMACDPCSGIIGCANGHYLAASGQIVDAVTGSGIDGVRIDIIRTSGLTVAVDSVSTTTSNGGFWHAELSPSESGTILADVKVSPPGRTPYRLHGVKLDTHEHGGDANLNERWVPFLYFDFVGEFFYNGTADTRAEGAVVEFRRTSGVGLTGPGQVDGVYRAPANAAGRVHFFPTTGDSAVYAVEDGTLTGDIVIHVSATDSTVISGAGLWPGHTFRDRRDFPPVIRAPVGP
jgi:hypothetical protein